MGFPMEMGIPWEWKLMTKLEIKWEGMGINLHGNGNGPYSHENKFSSATGFEKQQLVKVQYHWAYFL